MISIRLKHVARVIAGQAPAGDAIAQEGSIPFLQGCAEFGAKHPTAKHFCATPSKLAPKGSWLISVRAPVGEINYSDRKYGIGRGLAAIVPLSCKTRFLGYALLHARGDLGRVSTGSTYDAVSASQIGNLVVPITDLETQKAIADCLDRETARIDQLIEKRSRFTNLIFERRAAAIAEAVVGTPSMDGAWLENLPEGWKAERAKIHFRESQKRSETGEEELLTVSHITGVTKRSEKDVNMFMAESNEGYKLVAPGDLVINTMWAWMGAMGISPEFGLISPSYGVYSPISEKLRPAFVDMMARSKPFVAEATRRSKGIHSSRLRLYPDAFLDMRLPIPPVETQDSLLQQISERIQRENELLRKNDRADALLHEFRSALITAAITGQIDVATWGKQGQTDRRLDQIEEAMRA